MRLLRASLPLLLACALPAFAQSPTPKQPSESAPSTAQSQPCIVVVQPDSPNPAVLKDPCAKGNGQKGSVIKISPADPIVIVAGGFSTCYSIRAYQFAVPKDSEVPRLKGYSTCLPAAQFEARNVTAPSVHAQPGPKAQTVTEGR